jgi:4-hydroxymandelate oxidase
MTLKQEFEPVNLNELEKLAHSALSTMAFDYYASGANDEITLRENQAAFQRIFLRPRMLVDVSNRQTAVTALGCQMSMPIGIAPTAFQCMANPEGERATTRAAGRAGTIMILSTLSNTSIEDVLAVATGPVWFQLYVYKDREITRSLV